METIVWVASAASIMSFFGVLIHEIKTRRFFVTAALVAMAICLGIATFSTNELHHERLLQSQLSTLDLPDVQSLKFKPMGERCGIVLAVMTILEAHKDRIPASYDVATKRHAHACATFVDRSDYGKYLDASKATEDAAATMIEMARQLRTK